MIQKLEICEPELIEDENNFLSRKMRNKMVAV